MIETFTAISFRKEVSQIANLDELPPAARRVFDSAEHFESRGFQELNGYIGRKCVWSCAGYWQGEEDSLKFTITSMGNGKQLFIR